TAFLAATLALAATTANAQKTDKEMRDQSLANAADALVFTLHCSKERSEGPAKVLETAFLMISEVYRLYGEDAVKPISIARLEDFQKADADTKHRFCTRVMKTFEDGGAKP